tara:strand:- start:641 stop:1036 length:396 start_codon:yes stop_codon:yes gene_type:complete
MKKILRIIVLSLLFSGNAYSFEVTSLICNLDNDNKAFSVLIDHENRNVTWNGKVLTKDGAVFSASAVSFVVAKIGANGEIYVVMNYEINRVTLGLVQTLTMIVPDSPVIKDQVIIENKGSCKIGKDIDVQF